MRVRHLFVGETDNAAANFSERINVIVDLERFEALNDQLAIGTSLHHDSRKVPVSQTIARLTLVEFDLQ